MVIWIYYRIELGVFMQIVVSLRQDYCLAVICLDSYSSAVYLIRHKIVSFFDVNGECYATQSCRLIIGLAVIFDLLGQTDLLVRCILESKCQII